jgi:hypothetical protein
MRHPAGLVTTRTKKMRDLLASLPDHAIVDFTFDGLVFSVLCDAKSIAFPGEGLPWTVRFRVKVKTLRQESKRRLMREYMGVSIWSSRIEFGPQSYEGRSSRCTRKFVRKSNRRTDVIRLTKV